MRVSLTSHQVKEIVLCARDPEYFVDNYVYIQNVAGKKIKLQMGRTPDEKYFYQRQSVWYYKKGENFLLWKGRRAGASWAVASLVANIVCFSKNKNVLLVSRAERQAITLLRKVKYIINALPTWMRPEIYPNNNTNYGSIWRDDDGTISAQTLVQSLTSNPDSAVGEAAALVFIDEFAKIENADLLFRSILPTIAGGGQWIGASTPDGIGNTFHRLVMEARNNNYNEQETAPYRLLTIDTSQYNITKEELERITSASTADDIAQEWNLEFLSSERPVFNATDLASIYKPLKENPDVEKVLFEYKEKAKQNLYDYFYCTGVDTAVGKAHRGSTKKDYHSITSLTLNGIQVEALHSKTTLSKWAGEIQDTISGLIYIEGEVSKFGKRYPGLMTIEDNGPGETVLNNLNIPDDGISEVRRHSTTQKSKSRIIRQLILAVERRQIVITDPFTYECMLYFQYGSAVGTYQAPAGYYDDPVIALALAWDGVLRSGGQTLEWSEESSSMSPVSELTIANELENTSLGPILLNKYKNNNRLSDQGPNADIFELGSPMYPILDRSRLFNY